MASQEVGLATVLDNIVQALNAEHFGLAEQMVMPALDQYPHLPQLWFHAGNLFFGTDRIAMAAACYERALELEPVGAGYANLGACYRRMGRIDEARELLLQASIIDADNPSTWNNLGACFVNEGDPWGGMAALERALELAPDFPRAKFNLALLQLEAGNWKDGFKNYRWGLGPDRPLKTYKHSDTGEDIPYLPEDLAGVNQGDKLIVTGEQGIGDELMFGSLLYHAMGQFEVTFDCHPRLVDLFRRKYPELDIHPTRKEDEVPWRVDHDWHISIADLAGYWLDSWASFTRLWQGNAPFYWSDPNESAQYRLMLEALAEGRKIIGLATRGGVLKTNRFYRTLRPADLDTLLSDNRYMFVSLDYENVQPMIEAVNKRYGEGTMYGFRAITHHFNYDHTASLVAATDANLTVCQSVFHLSAAMGCPTLCLVPDKPAWRYGVKGKRHFWYQGKQIRLFRQAPGEPWSKAVEAAAKHLEGVNA